MSIFSGRGDVVITGLGAITPVGHTAAAYWRSLCNGASGVAELQKFDTAAYATHIAGEVRDWDAATAIGERNARRLDRFSQFALAAAREAWRDAGFDASPPDPDATGVLIGTSHGGEETLLAEARNVFDGHIDRVSPWSVPRMLGNMAAAQVAIELGLHGPSFTIMSACATGNHAIGEAAEIILRGDASVMVCGATDACLTPVTLAGDQASGALSKRNEDPASASRPLDAQRDGFVLAEGAGVLVLEDGGHARARGATIYARLAGYGATADGYHQTRPSPSGAQAARAMQRAIASAGLTVSDIDAVLLHATSTAIGDVAEIEALRSVFGERLARLPLTATKSLTGHLTGAAGAVQAIAAVMAIREQQLPPTINLKTLDMPHALDVVTGAARNLALRNVLSNAFGFGGQNASLVFSRAP